MSLIEADPRYRFETYIVGAANRLAVAAARAVAQAPGAAYNPLFVYSDSGLGKTHLMVATGQLAVQLHPALRVRYATVAEFVDELHDAVASGRMDAFKGRYHEVDMLLLDDVQFLAGRRETQAEILRLFNLLLRGGRQLILASDRPPAEISDLDEQLITRFSGGLIVDIDAPDYETRLAILRQMCEARTVRFRTGVLEAVAQMGHGNVRELQGAFTRLAAFQTLGEGDVTVQNVHGVLGEASHRATPASVARDEFASFVSDLSEAVAQHIESWRSQLGAAAAEWRAQGYDTALLERALEDGNAQEASALLVTFGERVERLRTLEQEAVVVDPALAGSTLFRDPQRVEEAEELVARVVASAGVPGPAPHFTRAGFEASPSNQFALHAADAVAREPGRRYNPLFVHGPTGSGKSHLVHAIGNEVLARGAARVACVDAVGFTEELIAAMREGTVERWRARYRAADVLIMDDVQALAGKERTQEELFHLFNALYADGRQIILAADRPPKALEELEERLRSRFEGGLVVELRAPDEALCEALYERGFRDAGAAAPPELLAYLRARGAADVREIIVTVDRLLSAAAAQRRPPSLALARRELEGIEEREIVTSGRRTPAYVPQFDPFFLDREKTVWEWPDVGGRAIEELR
ncbi:MAG TPA: DnaA/Hda family protein [Gemmatimonadaceae bacterium]|nr:DnaA/Hda family protein [Gemmatimonadaceae bacterium]